MRFGARGGLREGFFCLGLKTKIIRLIGLGKRATDASCV